MTVDEQPYYSPTAVAFCLEQPCALPSEDDYRQRKQQESNPLLRMTPGYEVADTCNLLFEAALDRAFRFGQLATGRRPAPAAVPPCRTLLQSRHS